MLKEYTCIMCPKGCEISAQIEENYIQSLDGANCQKGKDYVNQELTNPKRNIATSVLVEGGTIPLASVRLDQPIPKEKIFEVMEKIKKVKVKAPVTMGQIVVENILGLHSNVIATKNIERQEAGGF